MHSLQRLRKSFLWVKIVKILTKDNFSTQYLENGSVYVHWPYCRRRCSYCSFVKFIPRDGTFWTFPDLTIEDAMVTEVKSTLKETPIRKVTSVFFGGGTPSLASPTLIEKILNAINNVSSLTSTAEITLEANPTSLETQKLKDFKLSGVNRLSLGIQSLENKNLNLLNREHSSQEALHCIEIAKKLFPGKLSVDMMFALPCQTFQSWERELNLILKFCDNHLSLYQLTLERGTSLYKKIKSGELKMVSEDEQADMYELAIDLLNGSGFHRYEVSNFAKIHSAESVHNKAVWQGGQYVGVGPGAHSRILINGRPTVREARINAADPLNWLNEVKAKGNGVRKVEQQSLLEMSVEYLATSLRTAEGATQERWKQFSIQPLQEIFPQSSIDPNLMKFHNENLTATFKGLNVLDSVLPGLINLIFDNYKLKQNIFTQKI